MDKGCIEVVVNTRTNTLLNILKVILIVLAVCFILLGIVRLLFFIPAVLCLAGGWYCRMNAKLDYEYALVGRELRVAKILNRERRKNMGTYDLDKLEILAPEKSHRYDPYRSRNGMKVLDFSDHIPGAEGKFHAVLDDNSDLVLTIDDAPGRDLIDEIKKFAPRKVFID